MIYSQIVRNWIKKNISLDLNNKTYVVYNRWWIVTRLLQKY